MDIDSPAFTIAVALAAGVVAEVLARHLRVPGVSAISTGAMFSSGFFLLPGLASAQTGPSVVPAYLLASFFIMPAMFSMAELSTAMPRAGGAYYFLDRSLGPIMGQGQPGPEPANGSDDERGFAAHGSPAEGGGNG